MGDEGSVLYAHSVEGKDPGCWEPLADHLNRVADLAAAFAEPFGFADAARAAGRLHDLGKATPAFQAYIRKGKRGGGPDHSTAGALLARALYGDRLGTLLAFGIAGHHAGLANGTGYGGAVTSLKERLKAGSRVAPPAGVEPPDAAAVRAPFDARTRTPFGDALLARMLFSCLVDADSLATEAFYLRAEGRSPDRGSSVTLATLRDRLASHLAALSAKARPGPVNALRARVLDAVSAGADEAPGLFTLTVPTGGGKTLASLSFALHHAVRLNRPRVIYVIPFTSIIEQTADVFRTALGDDDAILEHHSAFEADPPKTDRGADDEGADGARKLRQAAENWDRPVVVTTAVQFFESLFAARRSRCRKLHNIAGSVIVLDEAQTLPLPLLRPCLEALKTLAADYGCSVVLCTATQPAVREKDGFAGGLIDTRELAPTPECLYQSLRRVTVRRCEAPLTVEDLAARMAETPRVLVIVNNRRHARALHRAAGALEGVRVLTTALCGAHRRTVLAGVRETLGRGGGGPVRLIATSLVEAGVDLDFPVVYRAMAGLESIAQAAGRCNREGRLGEDGGRLMLFTPAEAEHGPPRELLAFAGAAETVLRARPDDPLGLEAIRLYFGDLYWRKGAAGLDDARVGTLRGILPALDEAGGDRLFPFADIADAFRMIDDAQRPVIVPYAPRAAEILALLDTLGRGGHPGHVARALQPFTVPVPRSAHARLLAARVVAPQRPAQFGDRFMVLSNTDLYDPASGLDWDDPTYRRIEGAIF